MLKDGDRVVAGVSGGADSVFLFFMLAELAGPMNFALEAVHVHHGIRGAEADRDAEFVRELCAGARVPCLIVRRDIPGEAAEDGLTLEEAGRRARYEIFRAEAGRLGGAKIALAHHMDDQAETVLFRAARGTGIRGLAAMRPVSGDVIRPLLRLTREEIEGALRESGRSWIHDSTNDLPDAARNRIRQAILPALEEQVSRGAARHLASLAERADEAARFIESEAARRAGQYVRSEGEDALVLVTLAGEPAVIRAEILRTAYLKVSGSAADLTADHIGGMEALLGKPQDMRIALPHGVTARAERDRIRLTRGEAEEELPGEAVPLPEELRTGPDGTARAAFGDMVFEARLSDRAPDPVPEKRYTKWLDYDKMTRTPVVRTRRPGDFLSIGPECTKKLSDYFTDTKVPRSLRDRIPLVASGSEIVWVVGMRIGWRFRIGADTKRVLEVRAQSLEGGYSCE